MDALELALHCSGLMRPLPRSELHDSSSMDTSVDSSSAGNRTDVPLRSHARMDETECERHFKLCGMCFSASYTQHCEKDKCQISVVDHTAKQITHDNS